MGFRGLYAPVTMPAPVMGGERSKEGARLGVWLCAPQDHKT